MAMKKKEKYCVRGIMVPGKPRYLSHGDEWRRWSLFVSLVSCYDLPTLTIRSIARTGVEE